MHHFFVDPSEIFEETVHITGDNYKHLKTVLRAELGEHVLISDGSGTDYECEVREILDREILLHICFREEMQELPAEVYLFQGLPKADKLEWIIQKAVELGAFKIVPLKTKNTVVKLDDKKAKSKQLRWQGIAEAAAKQSKRSIIPEVLAPMSWKDAMNFVSDFSIKMIPYENAKGILATMDILREIAYAGKSSLKENEQDSCLKERSGNNHEDGHREKYENVHENGFAEGSGNAEENSLENAQYVKKRKIAVFIGPEGGFSEEEIQDALNHGVQPVTLGRRILRTETAAITSLSLIMTALEVNYDNN